MSIGLISSCFAGCLMATYIVALPVFYALFSFDSHWKEPYECYATQDHEILIPWNGVDPTDDVHNVSDNFKMLNLWGFINFAAPLAICLCCLLPLTMSIKADSVAIIGGITLGLFVLSYLSHFITSLVMRWRHAGRVCSGDFDSQLHLLRPLDGYENGTYLHLTGSWFFYMQATHVYIILMIISGASFLKGAVDSY